MQENVLPKSIVTRLAKGVLPQNTNIQKDAVLALTKGATVFINYLCTAYVYPKPEIPSQPYRGFSADFPVDQKCKRKCRQSQQKDHHAQRCPRSHLPTRTKRVPSPTRSRVSKFVLSSLPPFHLTLSLLTILKHQNSKKLPLKNAPPLKKPPKTKRPLLPKALVALQGKPLQPTAARRMPMRMPVEAKTLKQTPLLLQRRGRPMERLRL